MSDSKLSFKVIYRKCLWYVEAEYIVYNARVDIYEPPVAEMILDKKSRSYSARPTPKQIRREKSYLGETLKWEAVLECV